MKNTASQTTTTGTAETADAQNIYQPGSNAWVFIRSLVIWALFFPITGVICFIVLVIMMPLRLSHNKIHLLGFAWGRALAKTAGIKVEVEGEEHLHRDGPVILVSNHQSMFDIIVLYSALDLQFRWMAKASIFKIPIFGWAMASAGYIPVERGDKRKALKSLFDAAEKIREGASVIVFPEATRGPANGVMLPFKKGGFILAKKAGVVIQPMTIWGANRIIPKQDQYKIQRVFPGKVKLVIHPPIKPEEFEDNSPEELSVRLRGVLEEPMARLRKEFGEPPPA